MAAFSQASSCFMRLNLPSTSSFPSPSIHLPKIRTDNLHAPKIASNISLVDKITSKARVVYPDNEVMEKLYVILEAVTDRVEMHKNIGEQRNNWNSLLLTSINNITLTAATMAAITSVPGAPLEVLKLSSTFMYLAATGMLVIMNKIQPSQLAEEQRNAARLLGQLEREIKTKIEIADPTLNDVNEAMKKVLAIDRAYPLPLLGVMIEKFPAKIEPTVWWPEKQINTSPKDANGWNVELEEEMREIIRILEVKDKADYLRLGKKALKLNKVLAIAGPLLTGLGAIGSVFLGSSPWAMLVGVMGGAMASAVNSVQHGGQLGRSLSELRDVAASYSRKGNDIEEFGSKLF
ncbi:hypothetical protein L1987_58689 [Smallanthus sonchifolius]|uniref:Uncharacterized protein n=1 Tax=Smallanthus sonchifolius TaxID=185202 RepID=A0ACB9D3F8_9ASTR|nr:hypothetical protein L1987_58689 [Smallanthus sonchifolius]